MSERSPAGVAAPGPSAGPEPTDEQVAQYLLGHPDFLDRRADVLARLVLAERGRQVLDDRTGR